MAHAAGLETHQHLAGPGIGELDVLHHERGTELLEHRGADLHRRAPAHSLGMRVGGRIAAGAYGYAPAIVPPLLCLVEIPKGSRNKYEWDPELQAIKLDRFLFSSVVYPTDYGFIPDTLGADGDPLDAMVIVSEPTFPGCVIPVKPIALFKMRDDKGEDDKILCVPLHDPNWNTMERLEDLPIAFRDEISHFFSMYKEPEGKVVKVDGWFPLDRALATIEQSRAAWQERLEKT
ncbi:MAG: hypothetical protein NVSMB51_10270 [Solirubrobacteraceae bacterium]